MECASTINTELLSLCCLLDIVVLTLDYRFTYFTIIMAMIHIAHSSGCGTEWRIVFVWSCA